ncbi:MAG: hypothetical protein ACKVVT_07365 [Dehalococcoidia bacterium]
MPLAIRNAVYWPLAAGRAIASAKGPERRNAFAFFALIALFAAVWLAGISTRATLMGVRLELVRLGGFSRAIGVSTSTAVGVAFVLLVVAGLYLAAVWFVRRGFPHSWGIVLVASAVLSVCAMPAMLLSSPDAVHLAADVRTLCLNGTYPATREGVPNRQDDPVAQQVIVYHDNQSAYGPVAYAVGCAPLPFVGDGIRANILGQKVLYGVLFVVVAGLTGVVARRLGQSPAIASALVGLNPMFLWQFPGDAHNDVIMVLFGVLALYFLVRGDGLRDKGWAAGMGVLSAASKFGLIISSGIVFGYWFPRFRTLAAIGSAVLVGAGATGLIVGFGVEGATGLALNGITGNTPWNWLIDAFNLEGRQRRTLALFADLGTVGVTSLILLLHRLKTPQDLVDAIALQLALFVFLFTPELRQWYQFWAFPFIILSTRGWLRAGAVTFSLVGFLTVLAQNFLPAWRDALGTDHPVEVAVGAVWVITAAVAFVTYRRAQSGAGQTVKSGPSRAVRRRQERRQVVGRT